MIDANEVLKTMCEKYQAAVSANDKDLAFSPGGLRRMVDQTTDVEPQVIIVKVRVVLSRY